LPPQRQAGGRLAGDYARVHAAAFVRHDILDVIGRDVTVGVENIGQDAFEVFRGGGGEVGADGVALAAEVVTGHAIGLEHLFAALQVAREAEGGLVVVDDRTPRGDGLRAKEPGGRGADGVVAVCAQQV